MRARLKRAEHLAKPGKWGLTQTKDRARQFISKRSVQQIEMRDARKRGTPASGESLGKVLGKCLRKTQ